MVSRPYIFITFCRIYQFEMRIFQRRQKESIATATIVRKFKAVATTAKNKSAEIIEPTNRGVKHTEITEKRSIGVASVTRHHVT
jgi:hypothetical protein